MIRPLINALWLGETRFILKRCEAQRKSFGDDFGNGMDEADQSKISDIFDTFLFWQ